MRGRVILLLVPSLTMAIVGAAMFGPGAARPFLSAELWGGPIVSASASADRVSLRVMALERMRGIDSARDVGELLVRLFGEGQLVGEARCTTDASGACDVEVVLAPALRPGGRLRAEVYTLPSGRELASGELGDAPRWGGDGVHSARLSGAREHGAATALSVTSRRGVFVAPFRDELTVHAAIPLPFRFAARAAGADLDAGDVGTQAPDAAVVLERQTRHDVALGITARTHAVELEIELGPEGASARWTGGLPVVPGAMWLDPKPAADGTLRIVSAVPRRIAYASLASNERRLWGGAVRLTSDPDGFEAGAVTLPSWTRDVPAPLWLTISSDPRATGSGTVGWPLWPERTPESERERVFRDRRLLDGMPLAEQRDQLRRGRARRLAWVALVAAACVEAATLAQAAGRAREHGGRGAWVRLAVALATVVLAFTAVGLIVLWKTSS